MLQVIDEAAFDALTPTVIDEVPRRVRTQQDARGVVGSLVAERGSLGAAAMLLLADGRADGLHGVAAFLRSQGLRVSRPMLAELPEARCAVTAKAACGGLQHLAQ